MNSCHIQLVKQVLLAQLTLALTGMDPNSACQILAHKNQLTPVFPALSVPLIRSAGTERNGETDDKTENGKQ
jgi:hypothetical protein